ncbi:3-carboxy-cis,cis-muconate cycloisomerase [Pontivivens nitratireducens]|uniref:3-carboxy-cis,cis-muconate cycloisomerase n=1 Tax=Pontivivens nitratireducens TaxID=2758038 RepID=UPI00163A8F21|nr:3-carboxy-cis,cis-muconate cycloisomerase [Pontibrevibacter nitratireducens]
MSNAFAHPWLGGLFGDEEGAAIWACERQLAHMLAFEAAFSRARGKAGLVASEKAERAAACIATFVPDMRALRDGTARDGVPVPDLVRQLREETGQDSDAVHDGATSQDVIDTALVLCLRQTADLIDARLEKLHAALDKLRARFGQHSLMGRTRMQAALPITVANRLSSWTDPLPNHRERLAQLRPRVELLQLGGPTGDRAALGKAGDSVAAAMAADLHLGNPPRAWHSMRCGVGEFAGLLSLISGCLGKMGQDICLMAQQGLEEIALTGGGGSSAMPHKTNPVLAELLVTLARFNATQLAGMHTALVHEQERSGAAWMLEWMILPDMAQATLRSLAVARTLSEEITRIGFQD